MSRLVEFFGCNGRRACGMCPRILECPSGQTFETCLPEGLNDMTRVTHPFESTAQTCDL
jgi:hypothetical protein